MDPTWRGRGERERVLSSVRSVLYIYVCVGISLQAFGIGCGLVVSIIDCDLCTLGKTLQSTIHIISTATF